MVQTKQKPKYEPPIFRDLSGISASGGDVSPQGMCWPGSTVATFGCSTGGDPTSGTNICTTGVEVNSTWGECNPTGSNAGTMCITGGVA
jgi:hypothetical protein